MTTVIHHIKELVLGNHTLVKGKTMSELPSIHNAYLSIENGLIADYGPMADAPESADEMIDASGRTVLPCWCDSHTHLVYAGNREGEFVDRIKGLTYEEIADKGGGILNSAAKLVETPEEELVEQAMNRIEEIRNYGTGAVEIKSGYGLTMKGELKMLRVIQKLKELSPLTIKSTFLGAHAFPAEYKADHKGYIDLLVNEMLPRIAEEGLAEYIDVFCETGYFSSEETDRILFEGVKRGLKPKIHVNQFSSIGGIEVAVKNGAISVDHLEVMTVQDFEILRQSETIATALPSCSFFINIPYTPARKLIDAGIPLALATDYNPGSTPSGKIPFVISLACIQMKLLPEEAINAATINGAYAMEVNDTLGSITKGKRANVIMTKKIPSLGYLPYAFGSDLIERVLIGN